MLRFIILDIRLRLIVVHNSFSPLPTQICPKKPEKMSQENVTELNNDDLNISLDDMPGQTKTAIKRRKRQQGIIGLIHQNPKITIEEIAELLDANERTIKRDMDELKTIIEHVGPTKGGIWRIIKR
ncbi:MAG: DeoR family transcriptional regulator [Bacteroides sp.]|nr:DeoR family transcriptional regulator [Bacteroides sp.]